MSRIERALEGFREAAVRPDQWPIALECLAAALHSDAANVVLAPTVTHSVVASSNIATIIREYFRSSIPDPREQRVNPGLGEGFMPDFAYFSQCEIGREPYYQEFQIPHGFGWNATAALQGRLMIGLRRALKRGPYDGAELADLDRALPALRLASRIASATWSSGFVGQLRAFERLGRGAVLLDAQGRALELNALVPLGDGLDIVEDRLQASRLGDQSRLSRFLAAVLTPSSQAPPTSTTLVLPRPSGGRGLLLDGISCVDGLRSLHSNAAALLLITDLDRSVDVSADVLTRLFGLTPTEARMAREMAAGHSVREAALHLGISEGHGRQRLKSVFQKTQTARQGELIALLAKLGDRDRSPAGKD